MVDQLLDFSGRSILVVGGSSGIGNAIAQAFRRQGGMVHVWGTRPTAEDYAGEAGSDLTGLAYSCVDVTDDGAVAAAADALPELDVAILSQGLVLYRRGEFELGGFARVIEVNLISMMRCATALKARLTDSSGSLVLIGSTAMFRATMGNPAYSASKAGLVGLTRSLAEAWAHDGVRVNAVAPGMVATKLTQATTDNPERLARITQRIPAGRLGRPDEMAGAALFLASGMASYVVGEIILVDGGLTLA